MKNSVFVFLCILGLIASAAQGSPRRKGAPTRGAATPAPFTQSAPLPGAEAAPAVDGKLYSAELGGRDLRFLTEALEHGLQQVFLGDLAKSKGQTEQMKAVSNLLAQTQLEENKKLARLAAQKGVTLGTREAAAQKKLNEQFTALSGPKFEKTWFEETVALNERAVANYESALDSSDADIKNFVAQALPLAKEKLQMVNKMTGRTPRAANGPAFRTGSATPAPAAPQATPAPVSKTTPAPTATPAAKLPPAPGTPVPKTTPAAPTPAAKATPPTATPPAAKAPAVPTTLMPQPIPPPLMPTTPAPASPTPKATPLPKATPAPPATPAPR